MVTCPNCKSAITAVNIQDVDGRVALMSKWKCIAHTCPQCSCVLSVQIDPVALKTDTVNAVLEALRRK